MSYDGPKIRSRTCLFVLYPESQQVAIEYVQKHFSCAWALHDKDVYEKDAEDGSHAKGDLKKPHIHFVCVFESARYFHSIAKEIGVPANVICRCNNLLRAFEYLTHKNDPDKFQYDDAIVGMNEFEVPTTAKPVAEEEEQAGKILSEMPSFHSTREAAEWAFQNGCWQGFRSAYAIWRDIRAEEHMRPNWGPDFVPTDSGSEYFKKLKPFLPVSDVDNPFR